MSSVKNMRIETERLIIRPYVKEDLHECFELMQDKELFKYMDMDVMSLEEYRGLFEWLIDSYNVGFDGDFKYSFNVTLKETGRHIGWCGIGVLDYDIKQKEIYYLIGRKYQGEGYGKEAAAAVLDYGFKVIQLDEIVALCKPENTASRKIIENMGFKFHHTVEGLADDFDYYNREPFFKLTRDEYFNNRR